MPGVAVAVAEPASATGGFAAVLGQLGKATESGQAGRQGQAASPAGPRTLRQPPPRLTSQPDPACLPARPAARPAACAARQPVLGGTGPLPAPVLEPVVLDTGRLVPVSIATAPAAAPAAAPDAAPKQLPRPLAARARPAPQPPDAVAPLAVLAPPAAPLAAPVPPAAPPAVPTVAAAAPAIGLHAVPPEPASSEPVADAGPGQAAHRPVAAPLADTSPQGSPAAAQHAPPQGSAPAILAAPGMTAASLPPPAPAAAPAASAAEASAVPGPPGPAAQLGGVFAALQVGPGGASHMTIRLDPRELGTVELRIARDHEGTATVTVAVERPETLARLQADLPHLHQALDRAGVPEPQRSLSLSLAPPGHAASSASGGSVGAGTDGQRGFGQQTQHGTPPPAPRTSADEAAPGESWQPSPHSAMRWLRAGVDITA